MPIYPNTLNYDPRGTWMGWWGHIRSPISNFSFKKKNSKKLDGYFFYITVSFGRVVVPPRTYEKLHCKGEPYRSSGYRYPVVQTDRLLILYNDILFIYLLFLILQSIQYFSNIPFTRMAQVTVNFFVNLNYVCYIFLVFFYCKL